ncbi:MAG: hypothetical protein IPK76_27155 [Lewinellaceae bacterium]|nr:hypothetical protein [Lewinellaceae bacterium]
MKHGFEKIKEVCGVDASEQLFGFHFAPEHQCQFIDELIKTANSLEKMAASIGKADEISEAQSTAHDIEWEISGFHDKLEKMRKKIESLRSWGESWKHVAKTIGERYPETLSCVMEDNLYPLFEEGFLNVTNELLL